MQLWLNDPSNIEKLLGVKSDLREASKRRHGLDTSSDRSSPLDTLGRSHEVTRGHKRSRGQGNMSLSSDEYSNPASETGAGSGAKKARASISEEQREALNLAFFLDPYPGTQATDFLAQELGLEVKSITNWFHNHR